MAEIPRPDKILLAMFKLSEGTNKPLEYEDIVVKAWKLFPEDFGLRKYVQNYPDSSDIHKPLYGPLKDKGYVLSGNKKFKLTAKGISHASNVSGSLERTQLDASQNEQIIQSERLSRASVAELKRVCETDAFMYYSAGQKEKILDTDFYAYLAATVRTERHEFLGRLQTVNDATAEAAKISKDAKHLVAIELYKFVYEKFAGIIQRKQGKL